MDNAELVQIVEKIREDIYDGRGKDNPSMLTRLFILEDSVEKISSNLAKMVWLLLSILGAAVGNLFLHFIGK